MSVVEQIISIIAPHYCTGCEQEGKLICEKCAVQIFSTKELGCLLCQGSPNNFGICEKCSRQSHIRTLYSLGAYEGALERLIHDMKFKHMREAGRVIGGQLARTLPDLGGATLVVPLPTAPQRIRQRGFDQSAVIARAIARTRSWTYYPLLHRNHNRRQVGSDKKVRIAQAAQAYRLNVSDRGRRPVLLVDDVMTTGASLKAAAQLLHAAGYGQITAAVAANQLLKE